MTTARAPEGVIRFSTPNPWDDPLFRSAIHGEDRARRREEMQASIDKIEARRVGGKYREEVTVDPAPAPPALRCPARSFEEGFACGAIPEHAPPKPEASTSERTTAAPVGPIQSDTPPSGAEKKNVEEEVKMTATVKASKKAAPRPAAKPERRPCDCGLTGRHLKTCKFAPKEAPGAHACPSCPRTFASVSALSGHKRHCKGKAKAAKVPVTKPAPLSRERVLERVEVAADLLVQAHEHGARTALARAVTVRLCGPLPLEIECATVEDAAAFVRAVQAAK